MKNKSIFKVLYKYRNYNQRRLDEYKYYYKNKTKITNYQFLKYIDGDKKSKAYLDLRNTTIVIINNEGLIDNIIYLFDKYMDQINTTNILITTKKLLKNYYFPTKSAFIEDLYSLNFISEKLYLIIKRECL